MHIRTDPRRNLRSGNYRVSSALEKEESMRGKERENCGVRASMDVLRWPDLMELLRSIANIS
jgi:hypothetical protein